MNETLKFPGGFLWGAATSAHQVEGNNRWNDWWEWEKVPGNVADKTTSGMACDHWKRWRDDFALLRELNCSAYRMSVEWSRIEPEEGRWDETAIAHYSAMVRELRETGVAVFLTLHHFTNPAWFAARGGWLRPDAPAVFERFVRRIVPALARHVDFWVAVNEPVVYAQLGYILGTFPPKLRDYHKARRVILHMAAAHRRVYRAIHELLPGSRVGIAHNLQTYDAADPGNPLDRLLANRVTHATHHAFLILTRGCHDFLGVNYYSRTRLRFKARATPHLVMMYEDVPPPREKTTDIGWEIYPEGLYRGLMEVARRNLPIYVLENGVADASDRLRPQFIRDHLAAVRRAIEEGADVRGYLHWSLLDNFEWEKGFAPRFGLVAVDYSTQKRTIRESGRLFARIAKENALTV